MQCSPPRHVRHIGLPQRQISAPGPGHVRTLAACGDIARRGLRNGFSGGNAIAGTGLDADTGGVDPQIVRYSERPELWDSTDDLFADVWPEYNQHGQTLNHYWGQLYDVFPQWQFFLCDPGSGEVLAWPTTRAGIHRGLDLHSPALRQMQCRRRAGRFLPVLWRDRYRVETLAATASS